MGTQTTSAAPRVETRGPITVAGLARTYPCDGPNDAPAQWQEFAPFIGRIPAQKGSAAYGVCSNMLGNSNSYQYLAAIEVSATKGLPEGFTTAVIPERTYAVFTHRGRAAEIPATANAIFREELPRMGLEPEGEPGLIEVYDERFDPRTGSGEVEIWVPVKG